MSRSSTFELCNFLSNEDKFRLQLHVCNMLIILIWSQAFALVRTIVPMVWKTSDSILGENYCNLLHRNDSFLDDNFHYIVWTHTHTHIYCMFILFQIGEVIIWYFLQNKIQSLYRTSWIQYYLFTLHLFIDFVGRIILPCMLRRWHPCRCRFVVQCYSATCFATCLLRLLQHAPLHRPSMLTS